MKKIYLSLLAILMFAGGIFAQTATFGSGTTANGVSFPIYRSSAGSSFNFSLGYQVIPASVMTAGGLVNGSTITSLAWVKNTVATMAAGRTATITIRMKNSTASQADIAATWATIISGATTVYTTPTLVLPNTAGNWTIPLTTSFVYTGGALEISIDFAFNTGTGSPATAAIPWNYSDNTGTNLSSLSCNNKETEAGS